MMTYKRFDIVVVPFPFTDLPKAKRRPALVLSQQSAFNDKAQHLVLAMITSAKNSSWPCDVPIENLSACGLSWPSVIRYKLFTLDYRLIVKKCGQLARGDRARYWDSFRKVFKPL